MSGILLIDDTPADLHKAASVLSSNGYWISGLAENGEEGIALFKEKKPDLVLIDLILTGINGIDVLRAIRSEFPHARAVVCTSSGHGSVVDLAMREGAIGYIVKPYDPEILLTAVRRVLGRPG